jgi:hypothetical protein
VNSKHLYVLLSNKTTVRVRLAEIDTPERGQAFGNKAKQAAIDLAAGKTVKVGPQMKNRSPSVAFPPGYRWQRFDTEQQRRDHPECLRPHFCP